MPKNGRPSRKKTQVFEADRIDRAIKCLELKRNFDLTYKQVGDQIGISDAQAYRDVIWLLRKRIDEHAEDIDEQRVIENERIALLWSRWLPRALGNKNEGVEPDLNAAKFCERLIARRCELNGLNMPQKLALTDTEGKDLTFLKIPDERDNGQHKRLESPKGSSTRSHDDESL